MEKKEMVVFWVSYKHRLKKRFKTERWKPRYKWRTDVRLVVCQRRDEVGGIIFRHVNEAHKWQFGHEVKIVDVTKEKLPKEVNDGNNANTEGL
jgi:hypothetical protein